MNSIEQKILKIFHDRKVGENKVLKPQVVELEVSKWNAADRSGVSEALEYLFKEGHIAKKDDWYVLTSKGYSWLYKDSSINETELQILQELRRRELRAGNVIQPNWFISLQMSMNKFHQDNFGGAMENLHQRGIIENRENRMILTEEGEGELYNGK